MTNTQNLTSGIPRVMAEAANRPVYIHALYSHPAPSSSYLFFLYLITNVNLAGQLWPDQTYLVRMKIDATRNNQVKWVKYISDKCMFFLLVVPRSYKNT